MSEKETKTEETTPVKTNSLQEAIDKKARFEAENICAKLPNKVTEAIYQLFDHRVHSVDIGAVLNDIVDRDKLEKWKASADKERRNVAEALHILLVNDYCPERLVKQISERITSEIMNLKEEFDSRIDGIYDEMPE